MKRIKKISQFILSAVLMGVTINLPPNQLFVSPKGDGSFGALFTFIINILLGLVGLISMLFIIIGGFWYITSRGDEEQAATGKKTLTNAIIGLVIAILSYVIVVVIINTLNKTS